MPLTVAQQAVLIRKYEPHLVFLFMADFGKKYIAAPIDPDTYIRRCGLWADTGAQPPDKTNWGNSADSQQTPNDLAGTLEPEPALAAGKTRLKDALAAAMGTGGAGAFLSLGGWLEQSPFAPAVIDPDELDAGLVTADTKNRLAHLHRGAHFWTKRTFANDPPPFPGGEGEPAGDPFVTPPRYTAEAFDGDALTAVLPSDALKGLATNQRYFLWYHYFFPTHDALLNRCEMIALMLKLGVEIPDDKVDLGVKKLEEAVLGGPGGGNYPGALQDLIEALGEKGAHFSLPFASYLGDFVSVAVVVKAPTEGTGPEKIPPDEIPDELFEPPQFVCFGKKAYVVAATETLGTQLVQVPVMNVFSTDEIKREGLHPLVFVSQGSNHTYSGAEPPVGPGAPSGSKNVPAPLVEGLPTLCDVADVDADTEVPNTGEHKRRYRIGVSLAKIGAGLASGGGLGVVVGAAAALLEGIFDAGDDTEPDLDPLPGDDRQRVPVSVEGNFVVRSEETRSTFGDSDETFTYWPDDTASMVVDPADPPDWFRQPNLRFGVPALADPFNHRSGKPQPDFLHVAIEALKLRMSDMG